MSNSPERMKLSPEKEFNPDNLKELGAEHRERLRNKLETAGERAHDNIEDARHEALEKATSMEQEKKRHEVAVASPERHKGPIRKEQLDTSYKATMKEIQTHMSPANRTFSKVIHNKVVENVSDAVGNSVARPNAILSGAVLAFALTLGVYLVAKNLGYPLSGFETIGAFALGWILGLAYDFVKSMVTGK